MSQHFQDLHVSFTPLHTQHFKVILHYFANQIRCFQIFRDDHCCGIFAKIRSRAVSSASHVVQSGRCLQWRTRSRSSRSHSGPARGPRAAAVADRFLILFFLALFILEVAALCFAGDAPLDGFKSFCWYEDQCEVRPCRRQGRTLPCS